MAAPAAATATAVLLVLVLLVHVPTGRYWNSTDSSIALPANANASNAKCGVDRLKCRWSGDEWTAQAQAYLASRKGVAKPFFLDLAYTAPHAGAVGSNDEHGEPVPRISTGPYAAKAAEWGIEVE